MKIAAMFDMFGPYHLSRLNALGARHTTLGIEIAARSGTYDWEPMDVPEPSSNGGRCLTSRIFPKYRARMSTAQP